MTDRTSECAHESGAVRIADWHVDPSLHQIRRESDVVRLEPKVMQVLMYLARHAGRVVSRDELAGAVWAGTIVGDDAITNAIGKLRRALDDDPRKPRFVETVAKSGYRLTAPTAPELAPALPPATATEPRSPGAFARETLATAGTSPAVIGVLAFEQQGAGNEPSWLGDGLADELIAALANVRTFLVLARSATFPYRGSGRAAPHIANELGAQYLIAGSVRQAGARVRVTAELLDARKGIVIWSERFEGEGGDVFDFQERIAHAVVGAIEPHFFRAEAARVLHRHPGSYDAYECMLRGLYHMNQLTTFDSQEGLRWFRTALERDPNYPRALVSVSWGLRRSAQLRGRAALSHAQREESAQLAERALRLDPEDPLVLWQAGATALMVNHDLERAAELSRRSLDCNPCSTRAWKQMGVTHAALGEAEAALEDAGRALALSPRDPSSWVAYGIRAVASFQLGDFEQAVHWSRRSLTEHAGNIPVALTLAAALAARDDRVAARETIQSVQALDPRLTIEALEDRFPIARWCNLELLKTGLERAGMQA